MPTISNSTCTSRIYVRHMGIPVQMIACLPLDADAIRAVYQLNVNPEDRFVSVVELANAVGRASQRSVVAKLFKSGILSTPVRQDLNQLFSDFPSAFSQIELLLAVDDDLQRMLLLSLYRPKNHDPLRDIDHVFATLPHFDMGLLGGIFLGYLGALDPNLPSISIEYMRRNVAGGGGYLTSAVSQYNALRAVRVKYFSSEWSARIYMMSQNLHSAPGLVTYAQHHQLQLLKMIPSGVTVLERGDQAVIVHAQHVRPRQLVMPSSSGNAADIKQQVGALFKMLKGARSDEEYFKLIDAILMLDPRQYRAYAAKAYYIGMTSEHDVNMNLDQRKALREEMTMNLEIALKGWEDRQRREPRYFSLNPSDLQCYMDTQEMLDKVYRDRAPTDLNHPNPE